MNHCWADYGEWIEATYGYLSDKYIEYAADCYSGAEYDKTCLLPAEHSGPHVWTPSDQIMVAFADKMPEVAVPPRPERMQ